MNKWRNPIDDDPCFERNLFYVIDSIHSVSTGMAGDPSEDNFEEARWLKWKLSVWKNRTMVGPSECGFDHAMRQLAIATLDEFKYMCCRGICSNALESNIK